MLRRQSVSENDVVNFIIQKSKEAETTAPYDAKAWLLTGKSVISSNFTLQYEAYLLEKRLENMKGTAYCFEALFRKFCSHIKKDILDIATAVRICTLTKGKETPEQQFLQNVFRELSKDIQMAVLIQCSELTQVLFEKCQCMLLLVKLYPDTINQKNGGEMLFTLLACESDAYSTFRKLLVVELVPSVLQLSKNLAPSPTFTKLLNQCIEYYVLVGDTEKKDEGSENCRWEKLYDIVDQIGTVCQWKISPFFRGVVQNSGANSIESLYQALAVAYQHRNHYTPEELSYIFVVVFLRCMVAYYDLLYSCSSAKFGEKSKLVLVEVFTPQANPNAKPDPSLPVLTSVSNCSSVGGNQSQVLQHFLTAVKIWDMVMTFKGELKAQFFSILRAMHSLNLENWNVFLEFTLDYRTYTGQYCPEDARLIQNTLKLASMYCAVKKFKLAAEFAIKSVSDVVHQEAANSPTCIAEPKALFSPYSGNKEDFSFYNSHVYNFDHKGNFIFQRRVHFVSENRSEIIACAANILIQCFHESLDVSLTAKDMRCIGHLMTLLQLEWPSPPAESVFSYILELIRKCGSFQYFPFFGDYIIETDILEQFMSIFNHESKAVQLDLFPSAAASASASSRRMGTRGLEKGSKSEFKAAMMRQVIKSRPENLENLIVKFLTLNKIDILTCFDH